MKEPTILEQIILVSIFSLKDEAYGMAIRQKVKSLTGKNLMYGTLYNALDQLHRKGLIRKTKNPASGDRARHGRVYYSVSPGGNKALKAAYRLQRNIWNSVPEFLEDFE